MSTRYRASAFAALVVAVALTGSSMTAATAATPDTAPAATKADRTSAKEAARVDSVTATIDWFDCSNVVAPGTDCGTVDLPLDYDDPTGPTTSVAVLRVRATQPSRKLGTLFVNPGGPGGSAVSMAANASSYLAPDVLKRFDVVGVDPRGTNFSDNVACWRNLGEQTDALLPIYENPYPMTVAARVDYVNAAKAFGTACSTTGQPLSASMSTANVARDMDVLRRTLGDSKLSFLGFSYGTYLGNVYANLYPDRVRAIVIDGVLDPAGWQGRAATAGIPQTQRIASGDGAWKALREILKRCGEKGPKYCYLAQRSSNPVALFDSFAKKLKAKPIDLGDGWVIDYPFAMSLLLGDLYDQNGWVYVDMDIDMLIELQKLPTTSAERKKWNAAKKQLKKRLKDFDDIRSADERTRTTLAKVPGFAYPYENSTEAYQSVMCTDSLNPPDASGWVKAGQTAEKTGGPFGQLWTWASAPCASTTWTAKDEDAYRGSFSAATSAPVLVIGNKWDPATNYRGAYKAAKLLKNSSFISSNSWGHTAYGTSACVDTTVTNYLISGKATLGTKTCRGPQPFAWRLDSGDSSSLTFLRAKGRAPITAPIPGSVPQL